MSFYKIDENLASGNTDKVKEVLEMFAKDGDGVTFVSLSVPSVTFFTIDALKEDLESNTGDEEDDLEGDLEAREFIEGTIKRVEAKASSDKLVVVIDNNLNYHNFTL